MKSQIRQNAEKDSSYCPYCMRCRGLVRMEIMASYLWGCPCGASCDEREPYLLKFTHSIPTNPQPQGPFLVRGDAPAIYKIVERISCDSLCHGTICYTDDSPANLQEFYEDATQFGAPVGLKLPKDSCSYDNFLNTLKNFLGK